MSVSTTRMYSRYYKTKAFCVPESVCRENRNKKGRVPKISPFVLFLDTLLCLRRIVVQVRGSQTVCHI